MFDFLKKYFDVSNVLTSLSLSMIVVIALFIHERYTDSNLYYIIYIIIFIFSLILNFTTTKINCDKKKEDNIFTNWTHYVWPIILFIVMISFLKASKLYEIISIISNIPNPVMWVAYLTDNIKYIVYFTILVIVWLISIIHYGTIKLAYCK